LLSKRTFAWKIGERNHRTLREFLREIGIKDREFVTDNYSGFHKLIPEKHLFTGKDITPPIERDNSLTRHYLARFRRRTRVTSRSLQMVELSLRLLFHYLHSSLRDDLLREWGPTFV
jgi:insertion element IS1 protein InsB